MCGFSNIKVSKSSHVLYIWLSLSLLNYENLYACVITLSYDKGELLNNDSHAYYRDDKDIYGFNLFLLRICWFSYLLLSYDILCLSHDFKMKLGRTGYLMGFIRTYVHRYWLDGVWLMMRLGPVFLDALLRIPPAMMRHWAGCRECIAPDAASGCWGRFSWMLCSGYCQLW